MAEILDRAAEIENRIQLLSSPHCVAPISISPLLDAISKLDNDEMKFKLFEQCISAVEENDKINMEERSKIIDIIVKTIDSEIDAKKINNRLFSNPYFLIFMYISPWVSGLITAKLFDSIAYGVFITLLMYLAVFAFHSLSSKNNIIIEAWKAIKK